MSLQTLKVEELDQGKIIRVSLARPKALNTMNPAFFTEISKVFKDINQSEEVRAVILQAEGKLFTAGLDLKEAGGLGVFNQAQDGTIIDKQTHLEARSKFTRSSGIFSKHF